MSVDPIEVAFDIDENPLQRIQREVRAKAVKLSRDGAIPVEAGLAVHGAAYPLKGKVTFFNNQVDRKIGTILVKAEFPNPKAAVISVVIVLAGSVAVTALKRSPRACSWW